MPNTACQLSSHWPAVLFDGRIFNRMTETQHRKESFTRVDEEIVTPWIIDPALQTRLDNAAAGMDAPEGGAPERLKIVLKLRRTLRAFLASEK
ncbi:hypothetical protein VTO42DRAFT_6862 [Malbranchea cinnamomea]